jgi:hypothetical protein
MAHPSSQVKLILSPKQRAKPAASRTRHIHNALDAKITAGLVHNGERGFHMHTLWLYSSSISQSYRVLPVLAVYVAAYPD